MVPRGLGRVAPHESALTGLLNTTTGARPVKVRWLLVVRRGVVKPVGTPIGELKGKVGKAGKPSVRVTALIEAIRPVFSRLLVFLVQDS